MVDYLVNLPSIFRQRIEVKTYDSSMFSSFLDEIELKSHFSHVSFLRVFWLNLKMKEAIIFSLEQFYKFLRLAVDHEVALLALADKVRERKHWQKAVYRTMLDNNDALQLLLDTTNNGTGCGIITSLHQRILIRETLPIGRWPDEHFRYFH